MLNLLQSAADVTKGDVMFNSWSTGSCRVNNSNKENRMRTHIGARVAIVAVIVGLMLAPVTASAELLVYEGFDYTPDELLRGNSGGFGWPVDGDGSTSLRRSWSYDTSTVAESSLSYTDSKGNSLEVSGNQAVVAATNSSTHGRAVRYITPTEESPNLGSAGGHLWLSYIADATGSTSNTILDLGKNNPTSSGNVTLRIGGFDGVWSLRSQRDGTISDTDVTWDTAAFVMIMMEFPDPENPSAGTNVYMWLDADLDEAPDIATADAKLEGLTGDHTFDAVYFMHARQNFGSSTFNVDELRIGTTFDAVTPIPEPTLMSLLGMGAVAIVFKRRKAGRV